jgi:hypothetical protein
MNLGGRTAIGGVLALLLLSGCVGASGKPSLVTVTPTIDAKPSEIQVHEGPGIFHGRVLDDELRPLKGAQAEVFARDVRVLYQLRLWTNATGEFRITGMAQGQYLIYVNATGFAPSYPRLLEVADGKTTFYEWIMEAGPPKKPYHTTDPVSLYYYYHLCLVHPFGLVNACGAGSLTSGAAIRHYQVKEEPPLNLATFMYELRWDQTNSYCRAAMKTHVFSPDQPSNQITAAAGRVPNNPFHWDNEENITSPVRLIIPRVGNESQAMMSPQRLEQNGGKPITTTGPWRLVHEPVSFGLLGGSIDLSCLLSQSFQGWTSRFYGAPAAANFTVLPPG